MRYFTPAGLCFTRSHFIVLASISLSLCCAGDPLKITCAVEGVDMTLVDAKDGVLAVQSGERRMPAPADAEWRIEGNLVEHASEVSWFPAHSVERSSSLQQANIPSAYAIAEIHFQRSVDPKNSASADVWADTLTRGGALLALWCRAGQAPKVVLRSILPGPCSFQIAFRLSKEEMDGYPVLLLWHDGSFAKPRPDYENPATQRALVAIVNDDVGGLETALGNGAKIKSISRVNATLANYAAARGAVHSLEYLIKREPELRESITKGQEPPLIWAAMTGHLNTTNVLIAAHANLRNKGSDDPLQRALTSNHEEIVIRLIDAGALSDEKDDKRSKELMDAALWSSSPAIVKRLIAAGEKYDFSRPNSQRAMVDNSRAGNVEMVKLLLDLKVKPNATKSELITNEPGDPQWEYDVTALIGAAQGSSIETATVLLDHGADPNLKTSRGISAIQVAASRNAVELVRLLVAHGAQTNLRDGKGLSPLQVALRDCAPEAAAELIVSGVHLDLHSNTLGAILEQALRFDRAEIIASAINDGWSPNSKISENASALQAAIRFGAVSCEALLRSKGATDASPDNINSLKSGGLDLPLTIKKAAPTWDPRERDDRTTQTVRVEILVDPTGRPLLPRIVGTADHRLIASALRSIPNWEFSLPVRGGHPVYTRIAVPLVFQGSKDSPNQRYDTVAFRSPEVLHQVSPIYPAVVAHHSNASSVAADTQNLTLFAIYPDRVVVAFTVEIDGTVKNVAIKNGSERAYNRASIAAISQWTFWPAVLAGHPIATSMEVVCEFMSPSFARALSPYPAREQNAEKIQLFPGRI